jgi:guanyl-specific ribonuclease Sa
MKKKILAVVVALAAFVGLFASQSVQKQSIQSDKTTKTAKKTTKKAKTKQIRVTYTLKDTTKAKNKQTLAKKTFKVKKGTSVFTVLKKAWKVNYTKSSDGVFITKIKGLGNKNKKLYWTYTVDGKMPMVAADKQKLTKNKSKVVFTLKKY